MFDVCWVSSIRTRIARIRYNPAGDRSSQAQVAEVSTERSRPHKLLLRSLSCMCMIHRSCLARLHRVHAHACSARVPSVYLWAAGSCSRATARTNVGLSSRASERIGWPSKPCGRARAARSRFPSGCAVPGARALSRARASERSAVSSRASERARGSGTCESRELCIPERAGWCSSRPRSDDTYLAFSSVHPIEPSGYRTSCFASSLDHATRPSRVRMGAPAGK